MCHVLLIHGKSALSETEIKEEWIGVWEQREVGEGTEERGGKGNCGPDIKQTNKQIRKIKKKPIIALNIISFYKKLILVLKRDIILK